MLASTYVCQSFFYQKGAFFNYVDKILTIIDLPIYTSLLYTVDISSTTYLCTYLPRLVNVVKECPTTTTMSFQPFTKAL